MNIHAKVFILIKVVDRKTEGMNMHSIETDTFKTNYTNIQNITDKRIVLLLIYNTFRTYSSYNDHLRILTFLLKSINRLKVKNMRNISSLAVLFFVVITGIGIGLAYSVSNDFSSTQSNIIMIGFTLTGIFVAWATKVAAQWDRVIVLRLGKFHSLRGPGIFFIIPIIDNIAYWIDIRVMNTSFKAEKTLTKDTVPVDVDAVLFWKVIDPKKAALDVADYDSAISWASQTALRDVIGKTLLADMLEGRDKLSTLLQRIIDERTEPWGIQVISVEIKDVLIPEGLEAAMSMQAQAERERQARVILGDSERQIASMFEEASKTYADNPTAFHLRAMNMLYEGLKTNSTIVVVPSTAIETMGLGGITGTIALTKAIQKDKNIGQGKEKEKDTTSFID